MVVGIQGAVQYNPLFDMPTNNREVSFELLVVTLLRGRFTHHWVQIQQDYIVHEEQVSSKNFTGQHWLQKVRNHLWTHLSLAWYFHSADLRGIDAADQEAKRKAKLKPAVVEGSLQVYQEQARLPR